MKNTFASNLKFSIVAPALLLMTLVAAFFAFRPGLSGTFIFDDNPNIVNNAALYITHLDSPSLRRAALSGESGPLGRPLSMLSFAINAYATGFDPFYFKLTNLLIHLGNGIGIYVLSTALLKFYQRFRNNSLSDRQIPLICLATTAAWLLHPFNLTSVLYIVQRMTSLSAFFTIWGLALFAWGRVRLAEGTGGMLPLLTGLLVFTPLAALSKESGILLPVFMFVLEISLFRLITASSRTHRFLRIFYAFTVMLPAIAALAWLVTRLPWLSASYLGRNFTLGERLMTEARVLWLYLRQITLPDINSMGMFHDDIAVSRGLFSPWTTLASAVGIAALLSCAWLYRNKAPFLTVGILFFFVGHLLESTVWPLELVYEHRNYLPMYGIVLALFFHLLLRADQAPYFRLRVATALVLITLFFYDTWSRSTAWSDPFDMLQNEVRNHPLSARANSELANNYASIETADHKTKEAFSNLALDYYLRANSADPDYTNGYFGLILLSAGNGKPIATEWIDELTHRLRQSPLESDTGNKLIQVINCQLKEKCNIERSRLEKLLNAALENPTVVGGKRALILSSQSYYLTNIAHDYQAALAVMRQTVACAPENFEYRMTLIQFLAALHRTDEARSQLNTLKQMDHFGAHAQRIAEEERQLAADPRNRGKNS